MREKDFQKGMIAGARPFEDKFQQLSQDTRRIGDGIHQKLEGLSDIMDVALDEISDMQKQQLYQLTTPFDLKEDLDESEKELLAAALLRLSEITENNAQQKQFIRSVYQYIGIVSPQAGWDLERIERIEDLAVQKAILQVLMEYLFLETEDFSYLEALQESVFEYFSVNKKGIKEIQEYIQTIYQAVGSEGIAEKYGFVPEAVPVGETEEPDMDAGNVKLYDGSDISEACADQIHVRQNYVEVDNYLVYLEGGMYTPCNGESRVLYRVDKSTGERELLVEIEAIDKENREKCIKGFCGYGQVIYLLMVPDSYEHYEDKDVAIYQIDVETGTIVEFYRQVYQGMVKYTLQCSRQFAVFHFFGWDQEDNEIKVLKVIDAETKKLVKTFECGLMDCHQVVQEHLYFADTDCNVMCYSYQDNTTIEIPERDLYHFLDRDTKKVIGRGQAYLLSISSSDLSYVNLKNVQSVQHQHLPGASGSNYFIGYQNIYYFQKDSSIGRYNFITDEQDLLLESSECTYTGDVSKANVIGNWLYYQTSKGKVYKIALDSSSIYKELILESFYEGTL